MLFSCSSSSPRDTYLWVVRRLGMEHNVLLRAASGMFGLDVPIDVDQSRRERSTGQRFLRCVGGCNTTLTVLCPEVASGLRLKWP